MEDNKIALLIIDPNNDFTNKAGSLFVPGADKANINLAKFIKKFSDIIDDIWISQDTHMKYHIGHSCYWKGDPKPFTVITSEDIIKNKYTPRYNDYQDTLDYIEELENKGTNHTVWPDHCINGSWGWAINSDLLDALNEWVLYKKGEKYYNIFQKGLYPYREMYSAFSYLIGKPNLKSQDYILNILSRYSKIMVAAQAKDFCGAETMKDMFNGKFVEKDTFKDKIIFLEDCLPVINSDYNPEIYSEIIDSYGGKSILTTNFIELD